MSPASSSSDDRVDGLLIGCLAGPATEWEERVAAICARQPALAGELRRRFENIVALGIIEHREKGRTLPQSHRPFAVVDQELPNAQR